jgi:hypothetical protein
LAASGPISSRQTTTLPTGGHVESVSIAPFRRDLRIDAFAEPALVLAPAQAFGQQELIEAAALHGDPCVFG